MIEITNTSLQSFFIPFLTDNGVKDYHIRSKQIVYVPNFYKSDILNTLVKRRHLKVRIISDEVVLTKKNIKG